MTVLHIAEFNIVVAVINIINLVLVEVLRRRYKHRLKMLDMDLATLKALHADAERAIEVFNSLAGP